MTDYYEFLQISPNADSETIHRVYRFLAARFHPDNQKSGNPGIFKQLKSAYDVLSDASLRAEYDAMRKQSPQQPLSSTIDFLDNIDGELNRRLAVLAVLYYRRRRNPHMPEVSLAELEERMGFPRDYLDFTLWYLQRKSFLAKADNAQYALTAEGVDFVETERGKLPTLNRLLTSSSEVAGETAEHDSMDAHALGAVTSDSGSEAAKRVLSSPLEIIEDRREGSSERRMGAPDRRVIKVERRGHGKDRRAISNDRRKIN